MDRTDSPDTLDGDSRSEPAAYRSVSTPAVVGFVLTLLSPLALLSASLWWAPLVAGFVCFLGVQQVRREPETKTGLGLASLGLALSVGLSGAAYTRTTVKDHLHKSEALPVGERFLELLAEGDTLGAYELTKPRKGRRPDRKQVEMYYTSNEDAAADHDAFLDNALIKLLTSEDGPEPRLVSVSQSADSRGGRVLVSTLYELTGLDQPRGLQVVLERSPETRLGPSSWRVSKYEIARKLD